MVFLQGCSGAMAAVGTRILSLIEAREYRDSSIEIEDPRAEAADIFDELKNSLMNIWGKDLADQIKMNAAQYNSMLLSRR